MKDDNQRIAAVLAVAVLIVRFVVARGVMARSQLRGVRAPEKHANGGKVNVCGVIGRTPRQ